MTEPDAIAEALREASGILEPWTADEIISYLDDENFSAALELLGQDISLHESCGNQRKADHLGEIADRIYRL